MTTSEKSDKSATTTRPSREPTTSKRTVTAGDYLSSRDVATICGVDQKTIHTWTDRGILTCFRTPGGHGHRRYRPREVVPVLRAKGFTISAELEARRAADATLASPDAPDSASAGVTVNVRALIAAMITSVPSSAARRAVYMAALYENAEGECLGLDPIFDEVWCASQVPAHVEGK